MTCSADDHEIDDQAAHLFKHPHLGIDDVYDVWRSDPLFYAAKPPAHWLMVAEIEGRVLVVPLAPPDSGGYEEVPPDRLLRRRRPPRRPLSGGPMSPKKKMTRDEEHDYYSRPENQEPQGPARRRRSRLTEMVPVRFPPETLAEVHRCADEDDRSVSSWIRRAVEHELERERSANSSNNLSNEPRRTGPDDAGRRDVDKPGDLHQRGRRRTKPDGRHPDSGGS